ncbi:hypothetical protein H8711_08075 [Clostridiaceae bacterium NSJ-31]|uniref:Uncharacterized protein n=1 Tax=Ligaoa zhengdingensis TaxID=2763658 RepID=A0A926I4Y6_9FIRM|nr:hypothetical protein [Ligaoa zhengdingensis]MBC8546890.1 hypothetical protein [Ligaoa zhengdingensis]
MKTKSKKILAVLVAVTLACVPSVWALNAAPVAADAAADEPVLPEPALEEASDEAVEGLSKDESVYVLLDSSGGVKKQIVSSWLHSDTGLAGVEDVSSLQGIKNLKSDAQPERDGDKLRWNTSDRDVYYQGTTDNQLPVQAQISYKLNGREISPEDLGGESGEVEIRIKLVNTYGQTQVIDGVERPISPLFLTAVMLNLPDDTFTNVKADDGIQMNESTNQIIVFAGVPGLRDSFEGLFDEELGDLKDKLKDEFVVTAQAENFHLPSIMMAVANDSELFEDDNDIEADIDDLLDGIDDLNDATEQLRDGAVQLADAGVEFDDNMDTLRTNYNKFDDKLDEARDGANTLANAVDGLVGSLRSAAGSANLGALRQMLGALQEAQAQQDHLTAMIQALLTSGDPALMAQGQALMQQMEAMKEALTSDDAFIDYLSTLLAQMIVEVQGELAQLPTGQPEVVAPEQSKEDEASSDSKDAPEQPAETEPQPETQVQTEPEQPAEAGGEPAAEAPADDTASAPEAEVRVLGAYTVSQEEQLAAVKAIIAEKLGGEPYCSQLSIMRNSMLAAQAAQQLQADNAELLQKLALDPDLGPILKALQSDDPAVRAAALEKLGAMLDELQKGADDLADGMNQLCHASYKIRDAIYEFKDATAELRDKTAEFSEGMEEFQIDGIDELTDDVTDLTDDVKQALHIKDAICEASKGFTTYTGAPDGAETSVKFILKTDEIKAPEIEEEETTIEEEKTSFWEKVKGLFQR